jgi:hypothetical protein
VLQQLQMSEFVEPMLVANTSVVGSIFDVADVCDMQGFNTMYHVPWHTPPTTPHVKMMRITEPKFWASCCRFVYCKFTDEDISMLQEDDEKRQLYADLMEHTVMPSLRNVAAIVEKKTHLAHVFNLSQLSKMFQFGQVRERESQDWGGAVGTILMVLYQYVIFRREMEMVVARMKAGGSFFARSVFALHKLSKLSEFSRPAMRRRMVSFAANDGQSHADPRSRTPDDEGGGRQEGGPPGQAYCVFVSSSLVTPLRPQLKSFAFSLSRFAVLTKMPYGSVTFAHDRINQLTTIMAVGRAVGSIEWLRHGQV